MHFHSALWHFTAQRVAPTVGAHASSLPRHVTTSALVRLALLAALLMSEPAVAQLRYFGYAWNTDATALARTAPYTNFVYFATNPTDTGFIARVQALAAHNELAIVNFAPVLWDFQWSPPRLYSDWPSRWDQWAAANSSVLNSTNILAFEPFDEPFGWGIDMQGYDAVCARIKQTFLWVKVLLVEGITGQAAFSSDSYYYGGGRLPNVDWLSIDKYSIHPSTDWVFRDWVSRFKQYFPGKHWLYVLDGFWDADHATAFGYDINVMAAIADEWYAVAAADPDVIALAVWIWQLDGQGWIVSRDFPQVVLDEHRRIGARIVSDNLVYNSSFETLGVPTPWSNDVFAGWTFAAYSGSGSVSSSPPNPVVSGYRAARVVVTVPGDLQLTTTIATPSGPLSGASIVVEPNHVYTLSAQLLSFGGAMAGLRVIEWNSNQQPFVDRFLVNGGGTGVWQFLTASFLTNQATRYVSVHLMHHISAGTFTWDDVRLTNSNLAPDPSFESFGVGWALFAFNGSATMNILSSPVLSGTHAARVTVTSPGDINLLTYPESSAIWVDPGATYGLSAGLLSSGGAQAGLRVIEWSASHTFVADRFLTNGGGSGSWVTLDNIFTVSPNTSFISIRLVHHISAGTFTWDDVTLTKFIALP